MKREVKSVSLPLLEPVLLLEKDHLTGSAPIVRPDRLGYPADFCL